MEVKKKLKHLFTIITLILLTYATALKAEKTKKNAAADKDNPKKTSETSLTKSKEKIQSQIFIIRAIVGKNEFDIKSIKVKAGENVTIILANPDPKMPHNLIICAKDKLMPVALASTKMASDDYQKAERNQFIPGYPAPQSNGNPEILHFIPLTHPTEVKHITFKAPKEKGEYPYVCTYPGHWVTMKGIMQVF